MLWKKSRLPDGYQEVEYIQSSGTQYLGTGLVPTDNTKMELKMYTDCVTSWYSSGARAGGSTAIIFAQSGSTNGSDLRGVVNGRNMIASSNGTNWKRTASGSTFEILLQTNGNLTCTYNIAEIESGKTYAVTSAHTSINSYDTPINIFALHESNKVSGTNRLFYWKLTIDGTLVSDLVPCYRISDSEVGVYDLVRDTFLTNQGTGSFTKGADV